MKVKGTRKTHVSSNISLLRQQLFIEINCGQEGFRLLYDPRLIYFESIHHAMDNVQIVFRLKDRG